MRGGKGARSADQSAWPGGRLGISQFRLSFDVRNPGAVAQNAGTGKVYQLGSASLTGARGGSVTTLYDDAGNLTRMDLTRTGSCVPTSSCNQRFAYQWDEVGRLVRARRWNATPGTSITDPLPGTAAADLRYVYNAADQRVQKEAVDASNNKVYTAYLFDSLEFRRARYGTAYNVGSSGSDYELTLSTVVPFLIANGVRVARLVYEQPARVPEKTPGTGATQTNVAVAQLHVILELSDHLGSTSLSIDRATSEVTSRSSYQAYGASESDYRPTRWNSFREDYKFTGKEEDAEVGLTYFGKRYLNAYLGRWISADPLAIHAPGEADLNVYAYVSGSVLKNVDPLGLDADDAIRSSVDAAVANLAAYGAPTKTLSYARNTSSIREYSAIQKVGRAIRSFFGGDPGSAGYDSRDDSLRFDAEYAQQLRENVRAPGKNNVAAAGDVGRLFHESTHALLVKGPTTEIRGFVASGTKAFEKAGRTSLDFHEAAATYSGSRFQAFWSAAKGLDHYSSKLAANQISVEKFNAHVGLLRAQYNEHVKELNNGSDGLSSAQRKFIDNTVLEGRISSDFDTQFGSKVTDAEAKASAKEPTSK